MTIEAREGRGARAWLYERTNTNPIAETTQPRHGVDARGIYGINGGEVVNIQRATDLVEHGIIISQKAIENTWGSDGVKAYTIAQEMKMAQQLVAEHAPARADVFIR